MPEVKTYQQADEPTDNTPGTRWLADDGRELIRTLDGFWLEKGYWEMPPAQEGRKIYQQADEPDDDRPGTIWFDNRGKGWIKKMTGEWNYVGEWQLPNFHHLHVEGGSMLGPVRGAHGLMSAFNPAMEGTATLNDIDLADKQWTMDQINTMRATLENYISGALGGSTGNFTIGSSIAFGYGTVNHDGVVPLPKYSGEITAKVSDVVALIVSPYDVDHWNSKSEGYWVKSVCKVNPSTLKVECYTVDYLNPSGGDDKYKTGTAQYLIVCVKKV